MSLQIKSCTVSNIAQKLSLTQIYNPIAGSFDSSIRTLFSKFVALSRVGKYLLFLETIMLCDVI